jgi:hypothetical protein
MLMAADFASFLEKALVRADPAKTRISCITTPAVIKQTRDINTRDINTRDINT